jgi:hypothetical protein
MIGISGPQIAFATGVPSPPKFVQGHLQLHGSFSDPAKSGSVVTSAELGAAPIIYKSTKGDVGYALVTIEGFEYPIRTVNSGKTWRVAGMWFQNGSADGAAFASNIKTFSSLVAVAYDPHEGGPLYLTTDAGVQWYKASLWGTVTSVAERTVVTPRLLLVFTATVVPYSAKTSSESVGYRTDDGGKLWISP